MDLQAIRWTLKKRWRQILCFGFALIIAVASSGVTLRSVTLSRHCPTAKVQVVTEDTADGPTFVAPKPGDAEFLPCLCNQNKKPTQEEEVTKTALMTDYAVETPPLIVSIESSPVEFLPIRTMGAAAIVSSAAPISPPPRHS